MDFRSQIITTAEALHQALASAPEIVACDTETYKTDPKQTDARLLGLSLSWEESGGPVSCYIPMQSYSQGRWITQNSDSVWKHLGDFIATRKLVGWNAAFDRTWLDTVWGFKTNWIADGRIMWHLSNTDESIRGFGLKLAQKKLLGWTETNEEALERNVQAKGGSLKNGDHYLADLEVLAHYAQLDTLSTLLCYKALSPFFDQHNYWFMSKRILDYSFLLKDATDLGVKCDLSKLEEASSHFTSARQDSERSLRAECAVELAQIEEGWRTEKYRMYSKMANAQSFLCSPEKWKRFNPASSLQRALLLHQVLELPVNERTPTGKPKTDRDTIGSLRHPAAKHLTAYSESKKLQEMTASFITHCRDGRVHPGYNVCATVSGRLGGFSPYLLNAPFSESKIMSAFSVEEGYVGVHADLTAIEPCVTAAYSEDPNLLKVYRDGKGDIYLDLALDLFPDRIDLKREYNPDAPPPSAALKEKYKQLRGVCKIIHLAVGYTGSYFTVAKNLNKAGFPTSEAEARILVARYWTKFAKVKQFNKKLQALYEEKGLIRNLMGRIIRVDPAYRKDTLNRLVQSSGHDILMAWVFAITERCSQDAIKWLPLVPDIHDSVTLQVPQADAERTLHIYTDTLRELNEILKLGVSIRAETKLCKTLAGLKGEE